MKQPVIIWQKPENKLFGKVKVAVLVSPTLILNPKETPEMKKFDHHRWMFPQGCNPFGYKAIQIKELPSRARIGSDGRIEQGIYEQYDNWIGEFVRKAPSGTECLLIANTRQEYAVIIPRTIELNVMTTPMFYPFNNIMPALVDRYKEWKDCEAVALEPTDPNSWNIPVGIDTNDYWHPILCSRGLGLAPSERIKIVATLHVVPYCPVTEQKAEEMREFINKELLARTSA